jgi:hypothetical protein
MLLFPDAVEFSYKPVKRKPGAVQRYRFVYTERFVKPPKGMLEATITLLEEPMKAVGLTVKKVSARCVRISGTGEKKDIANMLVGEFLPQSNIGEISLGQILQSAAYGTMKAHGEPRFVSAPSRRRPQGSEGVSPPSPLLDELLKED